MILKTFTKTDGTSRVEIFARPNGTFGFEEWVFGDKEKAWLPRGYDASVIDTLGRAINEARDRVAWLSTDTQQTDS